MKALHLFAGIGGGALGFQRAGFSTVGAVDFDAGACRDFEMLVGRPCTHHQGDASVDTGHSPVSSGLPGSDGDAATEVSAAREVRCTARGTA